MEHLRSVSLNEHSIDFSMVVQVNCIILVGHTVSWGKFKTRPEDYIWEVICISLKKVETKRGISNTDTLIERTEKLLGGTRQLGKNKRQYKKSFSFDKWYYSISASYGFKSKAQGRKKNNAQKLSSVNFLSVLHKEQWQGIVHLFMEDKYIDV